MIHCLVLVINDEQGVCVNLPLTIICFALAVLVAEFLLAIIRAVPV